jgi:hypothetical protein
LFGEIFENFVIKNKKKLLEIYKNQGGSSDVQQNTIDLSNNGLFQDFEDMFNNQLFTDIDLEVDGQILKAHKLILSSE